MNLEDGGDGGMKVVRLGLRRVVDIDWESTTRNCRRCTLE
jgi:hypothetical protein